MIRRALETTFRRDDFRVCQISVQRGHLHLLVEADGHRALARGMQGFQVSCAKRLNRMATLRTGIAWRGRVFVDRYHARPLASPTAVRAALHYVLGNWRRHDEDGGLGWPVDPFSSAASFGGWSRPVGPPAVRDPPRLPTAAPRSWLLRLGWRRRGPLDPLQRPGPPRPRPRRVAACAASAPG